MTPEQMTVIKLSTLRLRVRKHDTVYVAYLPSGAVGLYVSRAPRWWQRKSPTTDRVGGSW